MAEAVEYALPWGPKVRGQRWGSGPDHVLLLHEPGAGIDIDCWRGLPRVLSRVLPVQATAYDLPGHGLSDDPWEPARVPDLFRSLAAPTGESRRTCLIAAGATTLAALDMAAVLHLAGLVCLSPLAAVGPAERSPRSPVLPTLLIAGSLAGDDLDHARRLAASRGGWSVVTSLPVDARGTGLLATGWRGRVSEEIFGFVRDCLRPGRMHPGKELLRRGSFSHGPDSQGGAFPLDRGQA